jgi:chromosome segregation ATPase
MDSNSIRQQLKKYKIQLHELQTALDASLDREKQIFAAEQQRIEYKTQEFREECAARSNIIKQDQMQFMETLETYKAQLANINQELADLQGHKFKLRYEVLNKIHAENRAKKDVRRNREVFEKQLTDLNTQITTKQAYIDNYETNRRQINEDYYNWKAECEETAARINTLLDTGDKKRMILQTYLDELASDSRAAPEPRYEQLDQDMAKMKKEIEQLGYQYAKLQNYMKTFTESIPAQKELAISTYLKDANARLPVLNTQKRQIETQIKDTQTQISMMDTQIQDLANAPIPPELVEQTARSHQRLEISAQRSHSEYDPLITGLKAKILNLDDQLSAELASAKSLINDYSTDSGIINRTIPTAETELEKTQEQTNNTQSATNTIDFTGKSRKEIERLKKQLLMNTSAPKT